MNKIRIIPTILYKNFSTVKGKQFDSWRIVGNIKQSVKVYSLREVDELIFLDINAYKNNKIDFKLIDDFADDCFMPLTIGGGIKTIEDIRKLLNVGADKISINTEAFKNPSFIRKAVTKFGSQCIVISVDYKKNTNGVNEVFIESGKKSTGLNLVDYLKKIKELNAGEVILTSIDNEGTMKGYDNNVYKIACEILESPVIASGGCGNPNHMNEVLKYSRVSALAAASMFHFTEITPLLCKKFLSSKGHKVRL